STESVITCEDRMQRLSCGKKTRYEVKVSHLAYGRTDRQTCSEGRPQGQLDNTACSQGGALETLANRCNGRRICEVDKTIFSDPCPGTYKYIQTTYTCLPFTCEVLFLSTPHPDAGQTIALIGAFYGRADRTTCIYDRPEVQFNKITCFTPTANRVVAERCNGKNRCSVYALDSVFQDPCPTTIKYMELAYTCECNVITCEGRMQRLSCDSGQTILLIGAFYGRADRTTCIYGRPDGQFNNINCFTRTANRIVAERCNGKKRCSVYAMNSVFQDPCSRTAKYMELAYTCECKFWKQTFFFLQCGFSSSLI
uniref:SUEL-type lectin domain-containing protein n=1 Tax=Gadus morhua TaxID=8049 RepID=A0A8C4ZXA5_GADMO